MKFDVIIIGGGLSGLTCGYALQKAGKKCLMVTSGQNVMYFSSGGFGLMSRDADGNFVRNPFEEIARVPAGHPYAKIGDVRRYAEQIPALMAEAGTPLHGDLDSNSLMYSALGTLRPTWMALDAVTLFKPGEEKQGSKALIANFKGYLDFNSAFVAEGLSSHGTPADIATLDIPEVSCLRRNPSEMRAVNIARVAGKPEVARKVVEAVNSRLRDEDLVVLPAVFNLEDDEATEILRKGIRAKVMFIGNMPPSVPGFRSQMELLKAFERAGGSTLKGDSAVNPDVSGGKVRRIRTCDLGETAIEADAYVLATGSFYSKGLTATPDKISETVFGLDVDYAEGRENWYRKDFFGKQAYLGFGVKTDEGFHPSLDGKKIDNLYAIGSVLSGYNLVAEGSGAGVAMTSALKVADEIIKG